jgi:inner membrane protein
VSVAFVLADDLLISSRDWSVPALGLLDEPAHLATAALLIASVGALRRTRTVLVTLAASVALDIDHLPLYVGAPMGAAGRPPTHSLLTVAALGTAGLLVKRHRTDLLAAATGVALHLVRDLATGPGVPLLWPISGHDITAPYGTYAALLVVAAAAATVRARATLSPPS